MNNELEDAFETGLQLREENQNGVEDRFLEHYGVKGQEWRKRRGPPYPLGSQAKSKDPSKMKANTPPGTAKKEAERTKARKAAEKEARKKANAEKAEARKAIARAKQKEKYARTAKSLYKHRGMYSAEEIAEALRKFEWENKIKDYADKELNRAKNTVKSFEDMSKSIVSIANSALGGYNAFARVYNTFSDVPKEDKLPYIENPNQNKDSKDDKDKKK